MKKVIAVLVALAALAAIVMPGACVYAYHTPDWTYKKAYAIAVCIACLLILVIVPIICAVLCDAGDDY